MIIINNISLSFLKIVLDAVGAQCTHVKYRTNPPGRTGERARLKVRERARGEGEREGEGEGPLLVVFEAGERRGGEAD